MKQMYPYRGVVVLAIVLAFAFFGCKKDACKDDPCKNGGSCVNGQCFCPQGFQGEFCEIEVPCDTITCLNSGTCNDGVCDCVNGYYGTYCEKHVTDPFIGTFSVDRTCDSSPSFYSSSITKSAGFTDRVTISNFYNTGSSIYAVIVDETFAYLPTQTIDGYTISAGSLNKSGGVFSASYNVNDGVSTMSCSQTYE